MNYTERTHPVQQFKTDIKMTATNGKVALKPSGILEGPIALECKFYLPRPGRLMRKKDPDGSVWHTGKPDLDNLYKSVQDALKGILWRDDSQIVSYGPHHGKWYAEKTRGPRLELTLYAVYDSDGGI